VTHTCTSRTSSYFQPHKWHHGLERLSTSERRWMNEHLAYVTIMQITFSSMRHFVFAKMVPAIWFTHVIIVTSIHNGWTMNNSSNWTHRRIVNCSCMLIVNLSPHHCLWVPPLRGIIAYCSRFCCMCIPCITQSKKILYNDTCVWKTILRSKAKGHGYATTQKV